MFRRDSTATTGAEALSGVAQSLQNFAPGLLSVPQRGHFAAIGEAHSLQNFAPSGFSAKQFWQRIDLPTAWTRLTLTSSITQHAPKNTALFEGTNGQIFPAAAGVGRSAAPSCFCPCGGKNPSLRRVIRTSAHVCAQIKPLVKQISRF
jgi:hypothetical protein